MTDAKATYHERLAAIAGELSQLEARDRSLSSVRGVTFVIALGAGFAALFGSDGRIWIGAAAAFAVFLVFVVLHALVSTKQFETERRKRYCELALERVNGTYKAGDEESLRRGDAFRDDAHPYARDIDLFGPSSLFEQLNVTQTPGGAARLAQWLMEHANAEEVGSRQRAAQELAELAPLREELALAGMRASKNDPDAKPFLDWADKESDFHRRIKPRLVAAALAVAATLGLLICSFFIDASWTQGWFLGVAVQVGLLLSAYREVEPIVGPVSLKQSPLGRYHSLMALIEQHEFEDERLSRLRSALTGSAGRTASGEMRRLEKLAGLAALRHNALIHFLANGFLLWDLWCAHSLDKWRHDSGKRVAVWLDALSELEALVSLATFAHEHSDFAWPEVSAADEPYIVATRIGHPLIDAEKRVCNDLRLDGETRALMITGSNMSGKSTMLRSTAAAAVMAQAGAPVCAEQLSMSELRVCSSIRVDDSLAEGASRFYAEVRALKSVVDAVAEPGTAVLFLLDEVLHGTNSRERNIGAKTVVRYLVDHGAIGAVSSHDLGLVELEKLTDGRVINKHFEDHIEDGEMRFDYTMKDGPVATSNALRLMRKVGLTIIDA